MSWFKKGDIVRVNGKPAIVDSDVYTKLVYDDYDHEIMRGGGEGGIRSLLRQRGLPGHRGQVDGADDQRDRHRT